MRQKQHMVKAQAEINLAFVHQSTGVKRMNKRKRKKRERGDRKKDIINVPLYKRIK